MGDMMMMCDAIEKEIGKIAEKGLTTSNLETAYKLIDMYKDLKTVEAMDDAGYSNAMSYDDGSMAVYSKRGYNDGMSNARRGEYYVRGHYSRNSVDPGERYISAKESYRYSRNSGDRQSMLESLDDYMSNMTDRLNEMMHDADTQEERDMIQKYISKIRK